jgi:dienelactone hydrolase
MTMHKPILLLTLLTTLSLLAACEQMPALVPATAPAPPQPESSPTPFPPSFTAPPPEPTRIPPTPTATPLTPQSVTFTAGDGTLLTGTYYPAQHGPAPVLVLIHWINGNQHDWNEIAPWMMGIAPFYEPSPSHTWRDAGWFPPSPNLAVNVFTVTLRNCENERCAPFAGEKWIEDALAALNFAATQPNANPQQLIAIGASIGADAATQACLEYNRAAQGECLGSFAISPGGYLGTTYAKNMQALTSEFPATRHICLSDAREANICAAHPTGNENYRVIQVAPGGHGMFLFDSASNPQPLNAIAAFVRELIE